MILLLVPAALAVLGLLLWGLTRLEQGLPTEPYAHQHHLNQFIIFDRDDV